MKKIKVSNLFKCIFAVALVLIVLPGCDCITTVEDLTPDPSEYCEWDGNYIYRGNMRAKTTGEDVELLLSSVEINGEIYDIGAVTSRLKYRFVDNNTLIFLANVNKRTVEQPLSYTDQKEDEKQIKSIIVRYSLKEKTHEILHVSYNYNFGYYSIKKYDPELGIVVVATGEEFVYIHYLEGEEFEPLDGKDTYYTKMIGDYVFLIGKKSVYYGCYFEKKFTYLRENSTNSKGNVMVTSLIINGKEFIFTAEVNRFFGSGLFLDLETKRTVTCDILTGENTFTILTDNLFVVGNLGKYYHNSNYTYSFIENPAIYKFTFENNTLKYYKTTDFPSDTLYESHDVMSNDKIYFKLVKPANLSTTPNYNPSYSSIEYLYTYKISKNKFNRRLIPPISSSSSTTETITTLTCGNLTYYMESDNTTSFLFTTAVFYFRSKDNTTGEVFLNYFFTEDRDSNLAEPSMIFLEYEGLQYCLILPY